MSFRWQVKPSVAWPRLAGAQRNYIRAGVRAIAQRRAPEITQWMQEHRVWTDQTGDARAALHTELTGLGTDMVEIIFSHGVDYGIWLELANGGRFQVIAPALDAFAPIIWQDVMALVRR